MKVIGVGLNKTGTKTLMKYLKGMGLRHHSYDLECFKAYQIGNWDYLFGLMEHYDSFEDWPWPLMYKEIDQRFPDAVFILTVRKNADTWYKSLCKMAVRMGPLTDFEKHIYGYSMPHGRKQEHIDIYNRHNREVEAYFKDRPGKLLKVCWGEGDSAEEVARFLNKEVPELAQVHSNKSAPVYDGDVLWLAHYHRIVFQTQWRLRNNAGRLKRSLKRFLPV